MTKLKKDVEPQDPTLVTYVRVKYSYDWEWLALLVKGERLYSSDGETLYYFNNGKFYNSHTTLGQSELSPSFIGPNLTLYRAKKVKVENPPCRTYAVRNPDQNDVKVNLTFSAEKLTVYGHEVSAEGVPIEDVLNSVSDLVGDEEILSSIGFDKINAWLASQGYVVI